jgi:hypothetical protein
MKKMFLVVFFSMSMLLFDTSVFAQSVMLANWGYGLETSSGVTNENWFYKAYSISIQAIHDRGLGLSLDYINNVEERNGFFFSAFWGFRIHKLFIPYAGGGLGFRSGSNDDSPLGWKVNGGITSWVTDFVYVKTGVSYDNVMNGLGVTVGVGLKLEKPVSDTYRYADGSTFRKSFYKKIWEDNSTPNSFYDDQFLYSEIIGKDRRYTSTDEYKDRSRLGIGTLGRETEYIATTTTTYYTWDVTVTRNWYNRTYYYKDRKPTTETVYKDTESAVAVATDSKTEVHR